jgi:hypothetical protein
MYIFYIAHYKIYWMLDFDLFMHIFYFILKTKSISFEMCSKTTKKHKNYQGPLYLLMSY